MVHSMKELTERERAISASRRRTIFVVTAMGAFMGSLDFSIVNVAFPALERTFSSDSRANLVWIITGYSIVFGSLLVIAGRTADRLGSRRLFLAGLGVFCLGSFGAALAPSLTVLIAGRVVQAIGAAAMLPSSLGLLLGAYPKERRAHIVSLWGGIGALAVATGPSVGAALISAFGWRAAFYVNLPIGLFTWLVGRRVLERTELPAAHSSPDYLGSVVLVAALAALVLAISQGPTWGWTGTATLSAFGASLVLGALFVVRSSRHRDPVLDLKLFSSRSFSVANAAVLLYAMGFFAMLLGNILFLTSVWHYTILKAGLAVTPGPLVVATVSGPAGKMAARFGFRNVLLAGFSVFSVGLAWYALRVGVGANYFTIWLPATLITGLGIGLTFPVLSAAAVSSLHAERFAVGSAVNQTARQVGGSIGVALLVVILGAPRSRDQALANFHHLWAYCASMALLSGVVTLMLRRGRYGENPDGESSAASTRRAIEEVMSGEIVISPMQTDQ